MSQLHKIFSSEDLKGLSNRYVQNEVKRKYIQEVLGIKKSKFFLLLKQYKENPMEFTVPCQRMTPPRIISPRNPLSPVLKGSEERPFFSQSHSN
jgi:hypothetical protein